MLRFINPGMAGFHSEKLLEHAHADTLIAELSAAIEYAASETTKPTWMGPIGKAAKTSTPKDVKARMTGEFAADSALFGGVFGYLDLRDRVKPLDQLDLGRMRWAAQVLDQDRTIRRLCEQVVVKMEALPDGSTFEKLQRVERDADIDMVCLALWWNRLADENAVHPMKDMCRDVVFCAQKVGQGLDLEIERFKRWQDEENKRNVMGKSAWRLALDMKDMVKLAEPQRHGLKDHELLEKILTTRPELKSWQADTCGRYLAVANKLNEGGIKVLSRWELMFQRGTLVDGITMLRAAATAAPTAEDMTELLETLFFEQVCKLRKSTAPKGRGHAADATNLFRGILLRRALFHYLRQIFPMLAVYIEMYGQFEWFQRTYKMTRTGHTPQDAVDSDKEDEPAEDPSQFQSKVKLINLCEMLARGKHDYALAGHAKEQGGSAILDLSKDSMRGVKSKIQEIHSDYMTEFPPQPVRQEEAGNVPSVVLGGGSGGQATAMKVCQIETEHDYNDAKAAWLTQCEKDMAESVEQYINSMVVLVVAPYETDAIEHKLRRINFLKEPGRKLFLYDSFCRDPANWNTIKRCKRNAIVGGAVAMKMTQIGDEGGDTLAVTKNTYLSFRTGGDTRTSEDIVACLVPGPRADTPRNDVLDMAWKSLKALGEKHQGPKIGTVRVNPEDVLANVTARGAWHTPPNAHLVFTYQSAPTDQQARKKMKYLKDQGNRPGDTYYNDWPVPMYQPAQMPRLSMAEHEKIFANDEVLDDDNLVADGTGAALVKELGDEVLPFPREFHVKFVQELIHVFELEAAVLFNPGSGQALLAFVLERKRAVGIVKNKAHRDFVYKQLADAVKANGLAPDKRTPKPQDLIAWEQQRGISGPSPVPSAPRPLAQQPPSPTPSAAMPPAPSRPAQGPTLGALQTMGTADASTGSAGSASAAGLNAFGAIALR